MELNLGSRRALVTGASPGIGRAVARALAMEGVRVAAAERRTDLLQALAAEVAAAGGAEIIPLAIDLTETDSVGRLADAAVRRCCWRGLRPAPNGAGGAQQLRSRDGPWTFAAGDETKTGIAGEYPGLRDRNFII